ESGYRYEYLNTARRDVAKRRRGRGVERKGAGLTFLRDASARRLFRDVSRVLRPHRLTVRTPLFQGGNRSSILLGGRNTIKTSRERRHGKTSRTGVRSRARAITVFRDVLP